MSDEKVQYPLRLPKKLKEELEKEAKQLGKSLNEYIVDILMRRSQIEHVDIERLLRARWVVKPVPYDAYCSSCGSLIPKNADAVWIVGTKINFCLQCMQKLISKAPIDTDYWKKALDAYKKYVQYRRLAQAAKKELDNLIDVINEAEARKRVLDVAVEVQRVAQGIEKSVLKVCDMVREWLLTVDASNEDLKAIREELAKLNESIQSQLDALKRKLDEIAAAFMKPKRKRKEVEVL